MKFQENTGQTIQDAFRMFDKDNPAVYSHFKRLALTAIALGKKKISSKMIINVIRWEVFIETTEKTLFTDAEGDKAFKINDAYTSRYARKFIQDFPDHKDKFELREIRSV